MTPSSYSAPEDAPWYHYSTGSTVADVSLGILGDSAAAAYAGQNSMIFNRNATGFGSGIRSSIGNALSPQKLLDQVSAKTGTDFSRYYTKGASPEFQQFHLLRDAHRGKGVFSGSAGGTGFQRMSDLMGGKNAAKLSARASVTIGVRSAWTALNFGLGLSAGKGIGSMIANYESHQDNDIQLESGGHFADTRASFTQRQRAIEVIHNSQLTTRAALGNEASFLHAN